MERGNKNSPFFFALNNTQIAAMWKNYHKKFAHIKKM
jgi:hypothetical protein